VGKCAAKEVINTLLSITVPFGAKTAAEACLLKLERKQIHATQWPHFLFTSETFPETAGS
jgi:hypothetical protein